MSHLNNFSVLPWYEGNKATEYQDFRKWWKYGHIYPLFATKTDLLPSQIIRGTHVTGRNIFDTPCSPQEWEAGCVLDENGEYIYISNNHYGVMNYDVGEIGLIPIIITFSEQYNGGKGWALYDASDNILATGIGSAYLDLPNDYPTTSYLSVVLFDNGVSQAPVYPADDNGAIQTALPIGMDLYDADGNLVESMNPYGHWEVKTIDSKDYLLSTTSNYASNLAEGQYYFKLWDFVSVWYSDVFTVVHNIDDFITVTWYDDSDFIMDAGRIVYIRPDNSAFENYLLLSADIAKPKYEFEEEGETRDGVFYPIKQISKKVYQMHILANEPLLDVMRLIRMADHVKVSYQIAGATVNLDAQTFLVSPEWEAEGDVAGVTIEFETDTVAKKVGLAYIR